ncbi:SpoIIIAH-like family protein [Ruminiclostridium cellobioparum]|uniref:SpoIIIAH-like family protein n=1 Tax=Ruminiclostridium cellobioparum TaxID=29355 RepID=UPI0028A92D0F|nr:SpoIIIAH-like family protein [Ruminiclostridium cellobioparum]
MKFLKRKQIIVLSLVLMLVIAGYLQYSYNKSSQFSEEDSAQIGDAVYVDNQDVTGDGTASVDDSEKTVTASKEANSYFAQTKMDRDVVRGKDIEIMKSITDDQSATKEAKAEAQAKMMKIVETSQKELNIENLIKGKGFSDVVALFGDDGSVDVVVKAPAISKQQTAQIVDIVTRQANIPMEKIVIKKYLNSTISLRLSYKGTTDSRFRRSC